MKLFYNYITSPLGEMEICANEEGLVSVLFLKTKHRTLLKKQQSQHPLVKETEQQLRAFFKKEQRQFDVPFSVTGTEFQKKVWQQLTKIPYGKTISYLELAKALGDEKCIRAAAAANGKNPITILIPCHRVIGSNGKLVGYAGDLHRKQKLLELEGSYLDLFS